MQTIDRKRNCAVQCQEQIRAIRDEENLHLLWLLNIEVKFGKAMEFNFFKNAPIRGDGDGGFTSAIIL